MRNSIPLALALCLMLVFLLVGCESPFAYSPEEWFAENPIPSLAENVKNPIGLEIGEGYEIPTLSITCDTDYYDVQKGNAVEAEIEISGDARFSGMQYKGKAEIKLRGNSTAGQVKRPFKVKLDKKANLFGMGSNKHWVLLANFYDRTHLRNILSYEMSGDLGMWYCESVWVRLNYNGEDYGLYQLCEQIRVDPERVDIFDWDKAAEDAANAIADGKGLSELERETLIRQMQYDLTWAATGKHSVYDVTKYAALPDIHGGFLIENDSYSDEPSKFTTKNGVMYMVTEPNNLIESREIFRWLKKYFQNTEDAIFASDRRDADGKHYTEYMDMDSFCDFWYVNEMFKNGEMLYKSTFLTLDHDSPIVFGPVWDMDWAGGTTSISARTDNRRRDGYTAAETGRSGRALCSRIRTLCSPSTKIMTTRCARRWRTSPPGWSGMYPPSHRLPGRIRRSGAGNGPLTKRSRTFGNGCKNAGTGWTRSLPHRRRCLPRSECTSRRVIWRLRKSRSGTACAPWRWRRTDRSRHCGYT